MAPVAVTLKLALEPAFIVLSTGCFVIDGATPLTISFAEFEVAAGVQLPITIQRYLLLFAPLGVLVKVNVGVFTPE